jgi:ribonuclease D
MELVDSQTALERVSREIGGAGTFYLDTEFQSSRERNELCLAQISTGARAFLVDTLRLRDLGPLARVLGEEDCEWVLHAGEQDLLLLTRRLGIAPPERLFDTQIAWALMSAETSVSLAYLVYRVLGLRTAKTYQADDWKRRPLPQAQLEYAAGDVRFLAALHARLRERARALGRETIVWDASREQLLPPPETAVRLEYDSFRNAWQLDPRGQAALVYLVDWYNRLLPAERAQAPEPKTLLAIASRLPPSVADLGRIKGVPRRWCERQGARLVGELLEAVAQVGPDQGVLLEPPPYATFEQLKLEAWLVGLRADVCADLELAPDLALPNRWLRRARDLVVRGLEPAALEAELNGWRRALLGPAISAYASRRPPPRQQAKLSSASST